MTSRGLAPTPAIVLASRPQGETGAMVRVLTPAAGLMAAYVAGGRGRQMRAVMVPGNRVAAEFTTRPGSQLPFARLELEHSRAALITEPLPAAAMIRAGSSRWRSVSSPRR